MIRRPYTGEKNAIVIDFLDLRFRQEGGRTLFPNGRNGLATISGCMETYRKTGDLRSPVFCALTNRWLVTKIVLDVFC